MSASVADQLQPPEHPMLYTLAHEYPYYSNVNLHPALTGFQAGLIPFLAHTSASRIDMFASHLNQALVIDGSEFPMIFAGPEQNLGEHEFSTSRRDQNIRVLAVIPKYPPAPGQMNIRQNPSLTVIYVGESDHKLHYLTLDSYHRGSDGFGYENRWENTHLLDVDPVLGGHHITKETRLSTSPSHKNGLYCMGVNLNVAYMTLPETIEDAMLISQSAADKMQTTEIRTAKIVVRPDQYPINSYGIPDDIKFMPDIGEVVNETGILAAFRNLNMETLIPDTTTAALSSLQPSHDDIYTAPPGSYILDITVQAARSTGMPKSLYAQADKYLTAANRYWLEIVRVYSQQRQTIPDLGDDFHTLVTTAIRRLIAAGTDVKLPGIGKRPKATKLIAKNNRPVEFMEITITYATKRPCAPGFKITGRDGEKGTISRILPDADMPVDDFGMRADLVVDPNAHFARMTMGPLYEPAINRTSEFVRRQMKAAADPQVAESLLLDYYNDINPNYAALVRRVKAAPHAMAAHVQDCIHTDIRLHIPPGLDTIGMPLIHKLKQKWNVPISPVTFTQRDADGNAAGTFRTKMPVCIGSKYVYLLCKVPEESSPGVAHINQYNTPMKAPPADRYKYPIKRGPIRFGEDELRLISMDLEDPREHMRLMCLQGASPKGLTMLIEALLTAEFPTRIPRIAISNAELLHSNSVVQVFTHMMSTMGLGSSTKGATPLLSELFEDIQLP